MTQRSPATPNKLQRIADLRWRSPDAVLQAAIDDARDDGVSWQAIGEALGLARGNAYQRYRHRLTPEPLT